MRPTRGALAAALMAAGAFLGSQVMASHSNTSAPEPPKSAEEIFNIIEQDVGKDRFVGTVQGWRVAPRDTLDAEGLEQGIADLPSTCEPALAKSGAVTSLDFELTYFPTSVKIHNAGEPIRWVCGSKPLSVMLNFNLETPYGEGSLRVERFVTDSRVLSLYSPNDAVESGSINGYPAILVHPADDKSGLGHGVIMVIEDDTPPEFAVFRLVADGIPFEELVKIAEGAK